MAEVTIIAWGKVWTMDEDLLANMLAKQIPMEPDSSEVGYGSIVHYCPMCGNILKAPTLEMFRNGSYCGRCGQKINWGGCSD